MGTGNYLPVCKPAETWRWPPTPSSAEVENQWHYTSNPPIHLHDVLSENIIPFTLILISKLAACWGCEIMKSGRMLPTFRIVQVNKIIHMPWKWRQQNLLNRLVTCAYSPHLKRLSDGQIGSGTASTSTSLNNYQTTSAPHSFFCHSKDGQWAHERSQFHRGVVLLHPQNKK